MRSHSVIDTDIQSIKSHHPIEMKFGARSSPLSLKQAQDGIAKLTGNLPWLTIHLISMQSPGDEDRATPLTASAPDFFTRYLDEAVLNEGIDAAIHSAKDLPDPMAAGLDWFWLPWREDARDVIVLRSGMTVADLPVHPIAGISSQRREDYCRQRFPQAVLKNIRGNIEDRLRQLDQGDFDILIMAAAALLRLDLHDRISEWIPLTELSPPDGQGHLAITFRSGDERMIRLRSLFIKTAEFIGAGPGHPDLCTLAGAQTLKHCDICLYDALAPIELLQLLPAGSRAIDVGKRRGAYKVTRGELDRLLVDFIRQGKKVVRLKGGDPGIFGRLAEEVAALDRWHLPYRVIPGVSSLLAATTGTGLLLTRRGVARGFTTLTPRLADGREESIDFEVRKSLPLAVFMAVGKVGDMVTQLRAEGRSDEEPITMVFAAGMPEQRIISGTLVSIVEKLAAHPTCLPGILLVGATADQRYLYPDDRGALSGNRILITGSEEIQERCARLIIDLGGIPIHFPLIKLLPAPNARSAITNLHEFDWVILTSPSAVHCLITLMNEMKVDLRHLPRILASGPGVSRMLAATGIFPAAEATDLPGSESLIAIAAQHLSSGDKVLRLRSELADDKVTTALSAMGVMVTDSILYRNQPVDYPHLPEFDVVYYASGSAFKVFIERWGAPALSGKITLAIGQPTAKVMDAQGITPTIISRDPTLAGSIASLAAGLVGEKFIKLFS